MAERLAARSAANIRRHGTMASVPEGVTLEDINSAKNKRMKEIAAKFSPPVPFNECQNIHEKRERLRCAYRRATGEAKDIDAFGNLMESLKQSDAGQRKELLMLYQKLSDDLAEFEVRDGVLEKHLNQKEGTQNYADKIRKFKRAIDNHECPIVVAGQTSAGKSTLLNLFLGEKILPSQLLSCTATICELAYAEQQAAEVIYEDGKKESIPFDQKEKYIYKENERDEKYTHQSVTIKTPVTFLKSGVVLVDTPGVGESVSMSSILLDYVRKKDVFGFIFVIKCDDSGGVLHRDMIRELAAIKDSEGHHKLEPKSVIFIANFWDKVPNDEKGATKDLITRTLSCERCLEGFDPEHQLFFINSNFAWHTWKEGLISEDFEKVINGIEEFFPIGHTRKLQWAYRWLEKIILQVMLRIETFLAKAQIAPTAVKNNTKGMTIALDLSLQIIKDKQDAIYGQFVEAREKLHSSVNEFLNSPEANQAITTWLPSQIPKKEFAEEWILLEERLDQAIDDRISAVLQDWEMSKRKFENSGNILLKGLRENFDPIFSKLDYIEESMINMSEINPAQVGLHCNPSDDIQVENRVFDVSIANQFARDSSPSLNEFLGSLFTSGSSLFKPDKIKQQKVQKSIAGFEKDKVRFMATRSGHALHQLCSGHKFFISYLVDQELQQMRENIEIVVTEAQDRAKSDKKLIEEIMEDKRENNKLDEVYSPIATAFRQLTEEVLTFRYKYIEVFTFTEGSLKEEAKRISGSITPNGCFGDVFYKEISKERRVIVKAFYEFVGRRHLFVMARSLRSLDKHTRTEPTLLEFLGLIQGDVPSIVLDGNQTLTSARGHLLLKNPASRKLYLQNVRKFVENLTRGIRFLHIRKLIHMEVSLDSILVNQSGIPKLSNISETIEVPFPDDKEKCGNFVYIAPETYRGSRYTAAADMYGLGLMLLEIWAHQDLYQDVKTTWPLNRLIVYHDPGQELYKSIDRTTLVKYHPEFVEGCVSKSPHERPSITEWEKQLEKWWNQLEAEKQI